VQNSSIPKLNAIKNTEEETTSGIFSFGNFEQNMKLAPQRKALHRHEFHEIFILEKGSGIYEGDFETTEIKAPCVVLTPAGTCHQWYEFSTLRGAVLAFDAEFISSHCGTERGLSIMRPSVVVHAKLPEPVQQKITTSLARISHEWLSDSAMRRDAIAAALSLILIDLQRHFQCCPECAKWKKYTPEDRLYADFLFLLESHWKTYSRPADYAAALNVSTDQLSAALRKATSCSTTQIIAKRILLEAKRLLAHTRLGIAEVSYEVGIDDPSYFTRFFKKHTALSPKQFREKFCS